MSPKVNLYDSLSNVKAEQAVLGAMILDPTIVAWLDVDASHFTIPLHRHVLGAIAELIDHDKPVDEITLIDLLESRIPSLNISEVTKIVLETPTADNAEHWVQILEEHRRLRELSMATSRATDRVMANEMRSDDIFDALNEDLLAICAKGRVGSENMADVTDSELARMESQWDGNGHNASLPTGIWRLDNHISGLPIGTPTAIGARPGVGKSTFLWNIAYNQAKRGDDVLILTNEDRPEVASRLGIAHITGIERRTLKSGRLSHDQQDQVREAVEKLRDANRHYHTLRIHGRGMRDVCREATAIIRRYGVKLVALDYIQNVPNPKNVTNRNYGIEENMTVYETMIAKENIPGIVVGQLRRLEKGARPTMQDFKDSGSIEQKCKLMIALNPTEHEKLECCIVKNSEGRQGDIVVLNYQPGYGRLD